MNALGRIRFNIIFFLKKEVGFSPGVRQVTSNRRLSDQTLVRIAGKHFVLAMIDKIMFAVMRILIYNQQQ